MKKEIKEEKRKGIENRRTKTKNWKSIFSTILPFVLLIILLFALDGIFNITGRDIEAVGGGTVISDSGSSSLSKSAEYVNSFIKWSEDTYGVFFAALFGVKTMDEYLFAKILLFLIIFAVSFMSLKRAIIFEKNRYVLFILSFCVSLLAVRYLGPENFVRAILLPYGAFGGAISIFLPLFIYFFFVHSSIDGGFGRRFAWFLYGSILFILWAIQDYMGSANWIYLLAFGFVLLNLIFDKNIHIYFSMGSFRSAHRGFLEDQIIRYKKLLKDAIEVRDEAAALRYERKIRELLTERARH